MMFGFALSPLAQALRRAAASPPLLVQETAPFARSDFNGTTTVSYTFPQASGAGNTLIFLGAVGYGNMLSISDSAGGTSGNGAWTIEVNNTDFSQTPGDGDPLGTSNERQYVFVRRNAPAGITGVVFTCGSTTFASMGVHFAEVSGLSNVAPIVRLNSKGVAGLSAMAIAVTGAGFMTALVRTNPSRTPVSASTGSVVRRQDLIGMSPYTGAVMDHSIKGLSTGARSFNSSWPDGAATTGYHGVFIPAA